MLLMMVRALVCPAGKDRVKSGRQDREAVKWHLISKAGGTTDIFLDEFAQKQPPSVREAAEKAAKPWLTTIAASRS